MASKLMLMREFRGYTDQRLREVARELGIELVKYPADSEQTAFELAQVKAVIAERGI